jgi:hypothetical protein
VSAPFSRASGRYPRHDPRRVRIAVLFGFTNMLEIEPSRFAYALEQHHLPYGCWSTVGLAEVFGWMDVAVDSGEHREAQSISAIWT